MNWADWTRTRQVWRNGIRYWQPYPLWKDWPSDYHMLNENGVINPRDVPYSCWYGYNWETKLVELLTVG